MRTGRWRRLIAVAATPLAIVAALAMPSAARADDGEGDVPPEPTLAELRYEAVWQAQNGGPVSSRLAKAAIVGTNAEFKTYLDTQQDPAETQDLRVRVLRLLSSAGPAVRAAAGRALDGDDVDRSSFLSVGFDQAWAQDERARALQVKTVGGIAVQQAATKALDAGDDAIEQFLLTGQYAARISDERAQALGIMTTGGQATRDMAKAALDAGPDAIHEFVVSGVEVGRARDMTLTSVIELANQAKAAGIKAAAETDAARDAAARAQAAAESAKADALKAAQETAAAKNDAKKAAAAAGRAADAANRAAAAAEMAIDAAGEAHSAARAAADAAGRAAGAAVAAGNAASRANSEASSAALDKNHARAARDAANDALTVATSAENAANAAKEASKVGKKAAEAALWAADASLHADSASAAADEAGGYSQAAGGEADRARRNAARAHQAAARATRAARKAVALANQAADAAEQAGQLAASAALHARAAAKAANEAADSAGEAADRAQQARTHAANAIAAAEEATQAAQQAATVQQLADAAETERLQTVTDEGITTATQDLEQDKALRARAVWDAQESTRRDAETNTLLAAASAPGVPAEVMLAKGRQAALRLLANSGSFTHTAAEDALSGDAVEMNYFLTTGLTAAAEQDDRERVGHIAENADAPAQRTAAETALAGSIQQVRTFLTTRAYPGKGNDDRARILQTLSMGTASHDAATAALDGTEEQRNAYLARGQYVAAEHDERAKILGVLSTKPAPGPEVQAAARIALAGPESYLRGFLKAGFDQAKQRDLLLQTHQARVAGVVAQAAGSAAQANKDAYEAAKAAALANHAEADAKHYSDLANASASAAAGYAKDADTSAKKAQQSAADAAASAATAQQAAASARADARAADKSAADARWSAHLAKGYATDARESANQAKSDALAAHKSAQEAQQAYDDAYEIAINRIKQEEAERRNNPDPQGDKHCNRPPGYGADASCYPSLPGMARKDNYGETVCMTWAVEGGKTRCGYYIVSDEERRIFEQERDSIETLNACALLIPGCYQSLEFLFVTLDQDQFSDPSQMADEASSNLMQTRMQSILRELKQLGKLNCARAGNSFSADTRVLMAGGGTKRISDVDLHDRVLATDPVGRVTGGREVTALHLNQDTALTDVAVRDAAGRVAVVHTTQEHPFWDAGDGQWTDAAQLTAGDRLATVGRVAAPTVVRSVSFTGNRAMYNLSVDDLHTYYVLVGTTAVLVHNVPPAPETCDIVRIERELGNLPENPHTLGHHVNVSPRRAVELAKQKDGGVNGVWKDVATAQNMVDKTMADPRTPGKIETWKRQGPSGPKTLAIRGQFNAPLGYVAKKDESIVPDVRCYKVVLIKNKSVKPGGYYLYTSYPTVCP